MNEETLEHFIWLIRFGIPRRKISAEKLTQNLSYLEAPVFFLSTGRCGTKWFSELLKKDKKGKVFHNPKPNFAIQNNFIYHLWKLDLSEDLKYDILKQILLSGRIEYFRYAYKSNKRFIETNNRITFFAPLIFKIFPQAKFVHLYRHPGDFVRSGMQRDWYSENDFYINRLKMTDQKTWDSYNQIEKISWLWYSTNNFIEKFKNENPDANIYEFNFNNLNYNNVKELLTFLNISIKEKILKKKLSKKVNVQRNEYIPKYEDWKNQDKKYIKNICKELTIKYNYKL